MIITTTVEKLNKCYIYRNCEIIQINSQDNVKSTSKFENRTFLAFGNEESSSITIFFASSRFLARCSAFSA